MPWLLDLLFLLLTFQIFKTTAEPCRITSRVRLPIRRSTLHSLENSRPPTFPGKSHLFVKDEPYPFKRKFSELCIGAAGIICAVMLANAPIADAVETFQIENVRPSYKGYQSTSGGVKALVQGLTDLTNAIGLGKATYADGAANEDIDHNYSQLTPTGLRDVIEADFRERNYLWTGRLTTFAYGRDCVFTDPTLTFTGVDTFKRNLANLSPAIDALVENPTTRLFKIELKEEQDQIIAEWEMEGRIRLPWRPRIKLQGETRYTFSPSLRNKVEASTNLQG